MGEISRINFIAQKHIQEEHYSKYKFDLTYTVLHIQEKDKEHGSYPNTAGTSYRLVQILLIINYRCFCNLTSLLSYSNLTLISLEVHIQQTLDMSVSWLSKIKKWQSIPLHFIIFICGSEISIILEIINDFKSGGIELIKSKRRISIGKCCDWRSYIHNWSWILSSILDNRKRVIVSVPADQRISEISQPKKLPYNDILKVIDNVNVINSPRIKSQCKIGGNMAVQNDLRISDTIDTDFTFSPAALAAVRISTSQAVSLATWLSFKSK